METVSLENKIKIDKKMSRGEKEIAGFLTYYKMPFEFERPFAVKDDEKTKIWHPDFTLYSHGNILIEYFGLAGANDDYDRSTAHKLKVYNEMNVKVISIFPQQIQDGSYQRRILKETGQYLLAKTKDVDQVCGQYIRDSH